MLVSSATRSQVAETVPGIFLMTGMPALKVATVALSTDTVDNRVVTA